MCRPYPFLCPFRDEKGHRPIPSVRPRFYFLNWKGGCDANSHRIRLSSLKNKTVGGLKVWGGVLSRLETDKETDTVYTYITREDTVRHDVSEEEIEGVANFMNVLGEGRASLILKERENGQVKGSFRTTKDDVDVSLYAKALGGGGHKKAAGFLIDGPIETAAKRVLGSMKHGPS